MPCRAQSSRAARFIWAKVGKYANTVSSHARRILCHVTSYLSRHIKQSRSLFGTTRTFKNLNSQLCPEECPTSCQLTVQCAGPALQLYWEIGCYCVALKCGKQSLSMICAVLDSNPFLRRSTCPNAVIF